MTRSNSSGSSQTQNQTKPTNGQFHVRQSSTASSSTTATESPPKSAARTSAGKSPSTNQLNCLNNNPPPVVPLSLKSLSHHNLLLGGGGGASASLVHSGPVNSLGSVSVSSSHHQPLRKKEPVIIIGLPSLPPVYPDKPVAQLPPHIQQPTNANKNINIRNNFIHALPPGVGPSQNNLNNALMSKSLFVNFQKFNA